MRTAIIGTGGIAATHARALQRLGHTPVAVVSRTEDGARRFAQRFSVPVFSRDIGAALADGIDAVHICTPPALHAEEIAACLRAGKHVVSEKPLCIDPDAARLLAELAERSGRVAALCCNVREYPANRAARELLAAGGLGRPLTIHGEYLQCFHAPPHDDGWRFDPALSGGLRAVTEIGTHWADLATALSGRRIAAVCAAFGNFYPMRYRHGGLLTLEPNDAPVRTDTEDAAAVVLRFEGGAIGTVLLSETARGHANDLAIEIACENGTLRWAEADPDRLLVSDGQGMAVRSFAPMPREDTFLPLFTAAYADMARPGEARRGGYPTFADGAYLVAVCHAIHKSAQSGGWADVELPKGCAQGGGRRERQ